MAPRVPGSVPLRVDAHAHVWDPRACRYPWLTPGPLHRPFDGADLAATLAPGESVVLVQAADDAADTSVMVAAAAHPALAGRVAGLVVWAPLDEPDRVGETLDGAARLASSAAGVPVVGVRTLQHDRPDPEWVTRPEVLAGLSRVAAVGLPYDWVTSAPEGLAALPRVLEAVPDLRVVIDHLGKPPLGAAPDSRALRRWREFLHVAAASGDVVAKLSGLSHPGPDPDAWTEEDVRHAVGIALEELGPERLMVGSDWPVCETAGGRARAVGALERVLGEMLDGVDLAAVRGATARRVYALA